MLVLVLDSLRGRPTLVHGVFQLVRELLLATGLIELGEIQGHQIRPVHYANQLCLRKRELVRLTFILGFLDLSVFLQLAIRHTGHALNSGGHVVTFDSVEQYRQGRVREYLE